MNQIKFYRNTGPYGYLSNFYKSEFIDSSGLSWPTSEHYFQAHKFIGLELDYVEEIRKAKTPMIAANLGRSRQYKIRDDWDSIRDKIMDDAIYLKFSQNEKIKNSLLLTEYSELIENSPYDYYWGCGKDGTGKNKLGKALERLRTKLRFKTIDFNKEFEVRFPCTYAHIEKLKNHTNNDNGPFELKRSDLE